ncbi:hypothetical protein LEP1GSC186_4801 [Leptospira noguchii serovar Autumnalis str. ZUN142]|uniref:Uncharacterized protein n=1 Tax=Leptospira noguchii serovar Autumnalis str. ZUN142 TaxID=1085540 RepID=M6UGC0_9LEPT|nr:hypothetical protein LEP1GSC186_4801 [Leptospira noguchii serovar Autumnalis str. ZUN142]
MEIHFPATLVFLVIFFAVIYLDQFDMNTSLKIHSCHKFQKS